MKSSSSAIPFPNSSFVDYNNGNNNDDAVNNNIPLDNDEHSLHSVNTKVHMEHEGMEVTKAADDDNEQSTSLFSSTLSYIPYRGAPEQWSILKRKYTKLLLAGGAFLALIIGVGVRVGVLGHTRVAASLNTYEECEVRYTTLEQVVQMGATPKMMTKKKTKKSEDLPSSSPTTKRPSKLSSSSFGTNNGQYAPLSSSISGGGNDKMSEKKSTAPSPQSSANTIRPGSGGKGGGNKKTKSPSVKPPASITPPAPGPPGPPFSLLFSPASPSRSPRFSALEREEHRVEQFM